MPADFQPATPAGSSMRGALSAMGQGQSLMQRAQQMDIQRQEAEQQRIKFELAKPLIEAQTRTELVKAKTGYDSALRTQEMRATALQMYDKAQQDFDHINTIEDATLRANQSREWLSRYSQLANVNELKEQVGQMNDLAVKNIETPLKLAALRTAEERAFDSLTSKMTPDQKNEAIEVKAGLRPRAVTAAARAQEVKLPDGSSVTLVFDPSTKKWTTPEGPAVDGGPAAGQPGAVSPQASAPGAIPATTPAVSPFRSATPGETEKQKQDAQVASELQAAKPKRQAALRDAEANVSTLIKELGDIEKEVGASTVGLVGAASASVPGTPAYDFNVRLQGIASRIATQALQKMREASPTGGALGNTSDKDLDLLRDQAGALRQGLSEREFLRAIDRIKDNMQGAMERQKQFFNEQYPAEYADVGKMTTEQIQERLRQLRGGK